MSYDGEIRINTKVDTSQMQKLQVQIDKTLNKISALTQKYDELKNKKIPTDDYKEVQKQIDNTQARLDRLLAKKESFQGNRKSVSWLNMNSEIQELQASLPYLKGELQDLVDTGKAFTLGSTTDEFGKISSELNTAQKELRALLTKEEEMSVSHGKLSDGFKKLGGLGKKCFASISGEAKKAEKPVGTFVSRLKGIALSLLIFNWITKAFNAMVSGIKEGFKNLVQYSEAYGHSVSLLLSANTQMKNSFAAAFTPIIQAVIPYLITLMNYITAAANKMAQFMAILGGSKTWVRATAVQEDYAGSLNGTAAAARKALGALARFDDLDVLNKSEAPGGGNAGAGARPNDMFEEVPVDQDAEDTIEGIKDWLDRLKEAALPAMEAFRRLWDEGIGKLKDFSAGTLTDFYNNFLVPVGRWVLGEGLPRFFDITNDLLNEIDWDRLREALSGLYDALSRLTIFVFDALLDFYEYFLKPLAVWVMGRALPQLADILRDLIDRVDWEKLNKSLEDFWKAIEPYAEQFGQGLIDFFSDIKEIGIAFMNKVPDVIDLLTSALNKGDPEKAKNWGYGLGQIAAGMVAIKAAIAGFTVAKGVYGFFQKVKDFGEWLAGSWIVTKLVGLAEAIAGIGPSLQGLVSSINPGAIGEIGILIQQNLIGTWGDTATWEGIPKIVSDFIGGAIDGIMPLVGKKLMDLGDFLGGKLKEMGSYILQGNVFLEMALTCFENAKTAFQNHNWAEMGMNIIEGIINGFAGTVGEFIRPIDDFFADIWDWICEKFDMHSPSKEMEQLGINIFLGIINGFTSMFSETGTSITEWFETYVRPWFTADQWAGLGQGILDGIALKWEEFKIWWGESAIALWWEENVVPWFSAETWRELAQGICDGISGKWTEMSEWWSTNIAVWWNDNVAPWFTVEKWKQLGDNMKKGIYNGFCGIVSGVVGVINGIISACESMINFMIDSINEMIKDARDLAEKVNLDLHIGTIHNVRFDRVKMPDIPALAGGAVLRGGNPFLAVLGDQPAGQTNIEAPQSAIEEAVERGMGRYMGGGSLTVNLNYDGETFARLALGDFLAEMDRQGYDIDILGGLT